MRRKSPKLLEKGRGSCGLCQGACVVARLLWRAGAARGHVHATQRGGELPRARTRQAAESSEELSLRAVEHRGTTGRGLRRAGGEAAGRCSALAPAVRFRGVATAGAGLEEQSSAAAGDGALLERSPAPAWKWGSVPKIGSDPRERGGRARTSKRRDSAQLA